MKKKKTSPKHTHQTKGRGKKWLKNRNRSPKGRVIRHEVTQSTKRKDLPLQMLLFSCFGGRELEIERKLLALSTFQLLMFSFCEDL